ncbi:alkaline phosphatase D [Kytococcus aerolatus]|uniref:Alkaline phosphatase D n=1 Tax=Kytococcus aerolatus TaxID=592308 RepID=A0A212U698_9MICO|nr:alkaline phosphatase D family protein [Kytococcus aerolatus]SNC73773.1 alkaline phosphatase D [Kytococcus aerolatus]
MHHVGSTTARTVSRRTLLTLAGLSGTTIALGISSPEPAGATPPPREDLFGLGVASGAPSSDGMVLWTRLAPEPLAEDGHGGMPSQPVSVRWEVARDEGFRDVVQRGNALAQPELAHSVHPQVKGLEPATRYFYRFRAGRSMSTVGTFRTLPAPGAAVDSFAMGVASCQAWYHGHFTAWKHLAAEPELDLTVFTGDYIYEYGIRSGDNLLRQGVELGPEHARPVETLAQYRLRYSLFKTDPHLQAAHARAPMVFTWDDHEVENNYANSQSQYGVSPEDFLHRRAVAYRAYYENLPLGAEALPRGPHSHIHHSFDIGALARLSVLDSRQYRDPVPQDLSEADDPGRTLLGRPQEDWLAERLSSSAAQWNVLANGVAVVPVTDDRVDQWDGFPAARRRLLDQLARTSDPVVLTGDIHHHAAAELWADASAPPGESDPVAVELICTSIGSDGDGHAGGHPDWTQHPYVKAMDARRGYVHVTLTPSEATSTFVVVPWVEADDTAPREVAFRFRTPAGSRRLLPA